MKNIKYKIEDIITLENQIKSAIKYANNFKNEKKYI